MALSSCSEDEALALSYYLYQMCSDMDDVEGYEEFQFLYNALIRRLNLESHADRVLNILLNDLEKTRMLIPKHVTDMYSNPFSFNGMLKKNYREDGYIFDNCGQWETNSARDVNLVRALFATRKNNFAKIVAPTFFLQPKTLEDKKAVIPNRIPVPANIKQAINNISPVQFAVDMLKLTEDEAKILLVAFRTHSVKEMYMVCNTLYRDKGLSRMELYSKCTGISQKDIRLLLKSDGKLRAYGLLDEECDIDEDAMDAIFEKDMRLYFTDIVKTEKSVKAYEPDSFSVSKEQTDVAVQLLKSRNACNILLYGAPGSGKTEYAKALVKQAGLNMNCYRNELEVSGSDSRETDGKALSRLNCYLSLKKEDSVLVVDEAENVLQTKEFSFFGMQLSSNQKGTVNRMLEASENKVIWIVNYTNEMDESTLRRFTYSIKFQAMPKETLRTIATGKLKAIKMPASLKNDILDLCDSYNVTGASVENIVKAINSLDYKKGKEAKIKADIKSVLEANSSLLYGKKKMRDTVKKAYDLSVLNTSISAPEIVDMMKTYELYRKENQDEENNEGVRMLFYGQSGTGKTELARYISSTLGRPLLLKRCSDLLGPYVGQTEKAIAEAFEEAEATDSILLFDEADSFFADRAGAKQSWERTQVNEFLTQMEEFSGICICTTNLRKIMDPAMQRRFHIICEFKALNEEGISSLLQSYFSKYSFNSSQIEKLVKYKTVTPGDFGSLKGKIRFIPKEKINSDYIVDELGRIQKEKHGKPECHIGFAV